MIIKLLSELIVDIVLYSLICNHWIVEGMILFLLLFCRVDEMDGNKFSIIL